MQSIKEKLKKSKWVGQTALFLHKYGNFGYTTAVAVMIGVSAFFCGRLITIFEARPTIKFNQHLSISPSNNQVNEPAKVANSTIDTPSGATQGSYVASKTGKSYYFPWCAAAQRIKVANRLWFATKAAAEAAGYKPASNCHGLK